MHFWVLPLASITRLPTTSAVSADHCGAAITSQAGSHSGKAPETANRGADPTSPIIAELTTLIGTGPRLNSKTSTPCRNDAGIYCTSGLSAALARSLSAPRPLCCGRGQGEGADPGADPSRTSK